MTDRITEIRTAHAKHAYASEAAISDLLAELDKRDAEIERLRATADSFSARLGNIAEIMRRGGAATAKISDIAIALGDADD